MNVTEVIERTDWQRLEPVWNRLVESSASATTFLTWEWLSAWWAAYGRDESMRILVAHDEDGVLRGVAPLCRETTRRNGRAYETLVFLADGSNDSDYLDFIVTRGFEAPVVGAFVSHLQRDLQRGVILRLNDMPAASPNLAVLKALAGPQYLWAEEPVPCATVHLPASWDEYLRGLRPRFRTKVRSVLRNLEGNPAVRMGFCASEADIDRLLPVLYDLHTRRWNADGQPGVFGWNRKRRFYAELSPLLLRQGALRFSWLSWNEKVLACQYGFVYGDTYLHLQEGYEPASEHWNVGVGLRAWTIRNFMGAGIREYDFLAGMGRHKSDWGAAQKDSRRIVLAVPTLANRLFCRVPEWTQRTKQVAKTVLPDQVIALRHRRVNGYQRGSPSTTGDSVRRLAAKSYFHLGFPTVSRLVRRRFEVQIASGGSGHMKWVRRERPAGRILYYHRVNDDRDPFFPSTPVDVFQGHMRHLARHYTVVSLAGLIEHLHSGSPETVVAVTLDDGYQDNCTNAFPILERYGLPATIFLSTGSLDSREPLWFETLAQALKTTSRDLIDVEYDVPRRFWLRNVEERLRANGELFTMLRDVDDRERQRRFDSIVRELSPSSSTARRDLMLTWDQVRWLRQRGIEFGGHTVTHPFVSKLSPERAVWEISECKRRVESELQMPVPHFAYPSGRDHDFAPWCKDVVRAAGYQAAVTTIWGLNYAATDRLELRRGGPWEEDEALFAYKIDWYHLVNG